MVLSPQDIELIRNREKGWEGVWANLSMLLIKRLQATVPYLRVRWPGGDEQEDFIAECLADFHRKAVAGTLLANYDLAFGDLIDYLTASRLLTQRAGRYLGTLGLKHLEGSLDLENCEGSTPANNVPDLSQVSVWAQTKLRDYLEHIQDALEHLELEPGQSGVVNRDVEMAGIQLFPHLDWGRPTLAPLWIHLQKVLQPASVTNKAILLDQAHQEAQLDFARKADALAEQVQNSISQSRIETLQDKQLKLECQRLVEPLDISTLRQLLGITHDNTVAQLLSRYRRALPELLPQLDRLGQEIADLRSSIHGERDNEGPMI